MSKRITIDYLRIYNGPTAASSYTPFSGTTIPPPLTVANVSCQFSSFSLQEKGSSLVTFFADFLNSYNGFVIQYVAQASGSGTQDFTAVKACSSPSFDSTGVNSYGNYLFSFSYKRIYRRWKWISRLSQFVLLSNPINPIVCECECLITQKHWRGLGIRFH